MMTLKLVLDKKICLIQALSFTIRPEGDYGRHITAHNPDGASESYGFWLGTKTDEINYGPPQDEWWSHAYIMNANGKTVETVTPLIPGLNG